MDTDFLLDIFGTFFGLRGIDHFHCDRLFCLSVHQQPHSDITSKEKTDQSTEEEKNNFYCALHDKTKLGIIAEINR